MATPDSSKVAVGSARVTGAIFVAPSKVTVGTGGTLTILHHGDTMEPVHIVIETVPYAGAVARYCCKAQLTERGEATLNGQDFSGRECTFNCLAVDGHTMVEYVVPA